jgi:hypothetical protein
VTVYASDLARSEAFYGTVLPVLGSSWSGQFSLTPADGAATARLHIGFWADSRAKVDEFWRTGVAVGYADDGAPGPRPEYGPDYYGGFLLDPDGNSAEAVHNEDRAAAAIDHLWIRVADLPASRSLCEELGLEVGWTHDDPRRVGFRGPGGSFSLVDDGDVTRNVMVELERGGFIVDADGNLDRA